MTPSEPISDARLGSLLSPFLERPLADPQLRQIRSHLELLVRWNSKINLTSVGTPDEMVARHFGESLFAARVLATALNELHRPANPRLLDFGSGAGFPGLPIKVLVPEIDVTLAESQHKKAVFLKEVIRTIDLTGVSVFAGRAEDTTNSFDVLTLRAVERPERSLEIATSLLRDNGVLLLMPSQASKNEAVNQLPEFSWLPPTPIPESDSRVVLIGIKTRPS